MRVLITGSHGLLGTHLQRWLAGQPHDVFCAERSRLASREGARELIRESRPDRVFHLGAQSSVQLALSEPLETLRCNVLHQHYLLEALCERPCPVLVAGSAEEYGAVGPDELPIDESTPLRPLSVYAVSKVGQDLMGRQFFLEHGLPVIRVRSFNHTGPGRRDQFAESSFAHQIVRIERGEQDCLRVGNLQARRDFSDARDAVRAYWLLLEKGRAGEVYNVCSGESRSLEELLDVMIGQARAKVRVEVDPERLRPADIPDLCGSNRRLREATGWEPTIPLEQTLKDLLEHWRRQ